MKKFIQNFSNSSQGIIGVIIGCILILGSLGKLGILQGILNTIMIILGIIIFIWGVKKSNVFDKIKNHLKKTKDKIKK